MGAVRRDMEIRYALAGGRPPRRTGPDRGVSHRGALYVRDFGLGVGVLLLFLIGAGFYYVERYQIMSGSMDPTLEAGGTVWAVRVMGQPERGDVVSFSNPLDPTGQQILIKRIIALPGETVDASEGVVHVNLGRLDESVWVADPDYTDDFDIVEVPDGHFFVMGDNRNESTDSRHFGAIPIESVTHVVRVPPRNP